MSKRFAALLLALVFLITGLSLPEPAYAADTLTLNITKNTDGRYVISYSQTSTPDSVKVTWHDSAGVLQTTNFTSGFVQTGGVVTLPSIELAPDHIYDIRVESVAGTLTYTGGTYFLPGMTFLGTSFDESAQEANGIVDNNPDFLPDTTNPTTIVSGENPVIRLRWKVPTIYAGSGAAVAINSVAGKAVLSSTISKVSFQISMKVGYNTTKPLMVFNTYIDTDGQMKVGTGAQAVSVIQDTDYLSLTLTKNQGITAGTEYENPTISLLFFSTSGTTDQEILLSSLNLKTTSNNKFAVKNYDKVYRNTTVTSLFTPLYMTISKVDEDKVEVRFSRITEGNYPTLFYQVQYASSVSDFETTSKESWVQIPNDSIAAGEMGREIVNIATYGTNLPYFRVAYYDGNSQKAKSFSMAINLNALKDAIRAPLLREVKAEALYNSKKTVAANTVTGTSKQVIIPSSDLKLSFEKPLAWRSLDWETYKNQAYADSDYIFHVLLSNYLPEAVISGNPTKKVGMTTDVADVYQPVKQKRVWAIGKKDLIQDPDNPDRLIAVLDGTSLFRDYIGSTPLTAENNEDLNGDGHKGDYPSFLIPNTTYYMQIFTSKYSENATINSQVWAEGLSTSLENLLSYKTPVVSFTTYPVSDLPTPLTSFQLDPKLDVDPVTSDYVLSGINVTYNRVLTLNDWQRYTTSTEGRSLRYEFYISRDSAETATFYPGAARTVNYPSTESDLLQLASTITGSGITLPDGTINYDPIRPNTVYYVKARVVLIVDGVEIGVSGYSAVKSITTPKIDSGGMENNPREPRAPSEFSVALDTDGEMLIGDNWVDLTWLHAESDVTYEMICTAVTVSPQAITSDYLNDPENQAFLAAYSDYRTTTTAAVGINVLSTAVQTALNLTVNENGVVVMKVNRSGFLQANTLYFFSLRAVRTSLDTSGNRVVTNSTWVTVPVTTKMVQAPSFLEAVKDVEIGFNLVCNVAGTDPEDMEVAIRRAGTSSEYTVILRSQVSVVKDPATNTFYFRIYKLLSDQWYDVRIKNITDNTYYNGTTKTFGSTFSSPVSVKTRNTLKEIEVRWEGRSAYTYKLEARTDSDVDYEQLSYSSTGFTHMGYDLSDGSRIQFYREKTSLQVGTQNLETYMYYAKITGKPVRNGTDLVTEASLKTNTLYYVKLWAESNGEASLHVGPATARTDFSQDDYDDDKKEDDTIDMFDQEADKLTQKLYWTINKGQGSSVRALVKDDMVSALLKAAPDSTLTLDLTAEHSDASYYEIIVPWQTLQAIETYGSRLNFKLSGGEVTLNQGSFDLSAVKSQALTGGGREPMIVLKIERSSTVKNALPTSVSQVSKAYRLTAVVMGSTLTYTEIGNVIYNILKKSDATGPFQYGILDAALTKVLKELDSYSYRTHTELQDLIKSVLNDVETQMSRYLRDMIDGGSGYKPAAAVSKSQTSFPGRIGIKLEYTYQAGKSVPYVNYGSSWAEASGNKAYVLQTALFRVEKPGEYTVVVTGNVSVVPGDSSESLITTLGRKYDLTKVFGTGTLNTANPVTGQQALTLYAVITSREEELTGKTPAQKATTLGLGDVVGAKQLSGYMDNQSSISMAVKLYGAKAGIEPKLMKPSKTIYITNSSDIETRLFNYVVVGLDFNFDSMEKNRYNATGRTTAGKLLDMVSKVLEKLGE